MKLLKKLNWQTSQHALFIIQRLFVFFEEPVHDGHNS